ncbi:methionyl-tRNA formyltransferase [Luteococcus japonicus]|uniref:Methionyl-tRNA formyltransferase n=1 Tax=Luteococcus japonicus TaxID=33984 RepID=A0A3N1ZRJ3_9ACTN|nr:methionyl-tRNA formyltransferase [Luteococcus japonicus]ROR53510.1 methionyl-tRNA formyltransferase [Luteococcus japonicus]
MRIVFAGTPEPAVPSLEALVAAGHEVVGVVTRPDAPAGRGKKLTASPVARRAEELGLEVVKPTHPRDEGFVTWLTAKAPEACPVVAYGALVPDHVLAIPTHGWINLHFSVLPAWRGAAPVQRSIMAGQEMTGATTFELVAELDAGPVYRTLEESIGELDTSAELLDRLAHRGAELLVQTLQDVEAGVAPTAQGEEGITLAPKLTVDQTRVSWQQPAASIAALVRGANPNPGAWTTLEGQRFKLWLARPAQLTADVEALEPGTLHATRKEVFVGTGDGVLELLRVQAFGKKEMAAADWARGMHQLPSGFDTDTEEQAR